MRQELDRRNSVFLQQGPAACGSLSSHRAQLRLHETPHTSNSVQCSQSRAWAVETEGFTCHFLDYFAKRKVVRHQGFKSCTSSAGLGIASVQLGNLNSQLEEALTSGQWGSWASPASFFSLPTSTGAFFSSTCFYSQWYPGSCCSSFQHPHFAMLQYLLILHHPEQCRCQPELPVLCQVEAGPGWRCLHVLCVGRAYPVGVKGYILQVTLSVRPH